MICAELVGPGSESDVDHYLGGRPTRKVGELFESTRGRICSISNLCTGSKRFQAQVDALPISSRVICRASSSAIERYGISASFGAIGCHRVPSWNVSSRAIPRAIPRAIERYRALWCVISSAIGCHRSGAIMYRRAQCSVMQRHAARPSAMELNSPTPSWNAI